MAYLHEGERVFTRDQNEQFTKTGTIAGMGRTQKREKLDVTIRSGATAYEVSAFNNASARRVS
jgi:hypothetical protein